MSQSWMIREDRLGRYTGAKLAQNKLHRNARTANDPFAVHDVWVGFNSFV